MKLRSVKYLLFEGLKNVWANRLMSIASVGVLIACMLLMGVAIIFSTNVDKALTGLQDQNVVMVYIKEGTDEISAQHVKDEISKLDNIKTTLFISKQEGLSSIMKGMGSDLQSYFKWTNEENPLPDAVQITFKDLKQFDKTISQIKKIENVETIREVRELATKIVSIRQMINTSGFWIIGLLMITALVIIANTVRITMHSRKLEISIMKAVGATNNFIRLPFIIEGVVLGMVSATLTTGILYFIYRVAIRSITVHLKIQAVAFSSFIWWLVLIFSAIGLLTGVIGSFISLGKYLRKEGSEFRAF
ncbi:MAG: hypothetical protein BGN88_13890 [Clostridiales bacterium 43-6]|nr:MAG: hypothetical protein BGN88_13890 [Clostridiales bacterium 43-6]